MAKEPPDRNERRSKDAPPPFQPDPRLVRFREGGSKEAAERWFREALAKSAKKDRRS
jgi:hypothetical protein